MKVKCSLCGFDCHKYGKTSAGKQRWHCSNCGSTVTLKVNSRSKRFQSFLNWLFSKQMQKDMKGEGRHFVGIPQNFGIFGHFRLRLMFLVPLFILMDYI